MITTQKIIDEVNLQLLQKYPSVTFYIQEVPQGFERPSFFITIVTQGSTDNNKNLTDESLTLQIVYFAPVDDYYITDKVLLQAETLNIKKIFRQGYIQVEDRAIKISDLNTSPRDQEIYIVLSLDYVEQRDTDAVNTWDDMQTETWEQINDSWTELLDIPPTMENIKLNQGVDE